MYISPDVGDMSPLHNLSNVDLPAPDGPAIVVIFPAGKEPVTFFKMIVSFTA